MNSQTAGAGRFVLTKASCQKRESTENNRAEGVHVRNGIFRTRDVAWLKLPTYQLAQNVFLCRRQLALMCARGRISSWERG